MYALDYTEYLHKYEAGTVSTLYIKIWMYLLLDVILSLISVCKRGPWCDWLDFFYWFRVEWNISLKNVPINYTFMDASQQFYSSKKYRMKNNTMTSVHSLHTCIMVDWSLTFSELCLMSFAMHSIWNCIDGQTNRLHKNVINCVHWNLITHDELSRVLERTPWLKIMMWWNDHCDECTCTFYVRWS